MSAYVLSSIARLTSPRTSEDVVTFAWQRTLALWYGRMAYLGLSCQPRLDLSKLRTQGCKLPLSIIRGDNGLEGLPVGLPQLR